MREILFRGKRIANGEWYYGSYLFLHKSPVDWTGAERGKPEDVHYIINDQYINYAVDPSTVGQYTGLTDKNGKRIFEGDVVTFTRLNALGYATRRTGDVRYYDKLPVFYIMATTGDAWDWCDCEAIEVIGTIHDNPELLKEEPT